jgi:hypothetical protein
MLGLHMNFAGLDFLTTAFGLAESALERYRPIWLQWSRPLTMR